MSTNISIERLLRFLVATPEQEAAIDLILAGQPAPQPSARERAKVATSPQVKEASEVEVFINKAETARRLGCAMRTLDDWMQRGIVPFYKVSKRVMFRWSEVQAVLERNTKVDRGGWKV